MVLETNLIYLKISQIKPFYSNFLTTFLQQQISVQLNPHGHSPWLNSFAIQQHVTHS